MDRAESDPKSAMTPFTAMSTRICNEGIARPSGPLAVILTADWDPPS
jgi:hypothetical protein